MMVSCTRFAAGLALCTLAAAQMEYVSENGVRTGLKVGKETISIADVTNSKAFAQNGNVDAIALGYSLAMPSLCKIPALEMKAELAEAVDDSKEAVEEFVEASTVGLAENMASISKKLQEQQAKVGKTTGDLSDKISGSLVAIESGLASQVASEGLAATCANGKKDGTETDVDCGGAGCAPCAKSKVCKAPTDCATGFCTGGKCAVCSKDANCGGGLCFKAADVHGSGGDNVCGTCKSLEGRVFGNIKSAGGVDFFCSGNGEMGPNSAYKSYQFDTCGKTGHLGPSDKECKKVYETVRGMKGMVRVAGAHSGRGDGGFQVFKAPVDGDYVWELYGAAGGADDQARGESGGKGGMVSAIQRGVKKGTEFYMRVGQRGYDCIAGDTTGSTGTNKDRCQSGTWVNGRRYNNQYNACGGFNGGGPAICRYNPGGSSGGGGTDVRMCKNGGACSSSLKWQDRFLVAGGGGGSAAENNHWRHGGRNYRRSGGDGGAEVGQEGWRMGRSSTSQGHREGTNNGLGGTQTAGGKVRNNENSGATPGALGQGGTGGENDSGGGGGGYFGGGGAGHNAGGGGGSNFVKGNGVSGTVVLLANIRGHKDQYENEGKIRLRIL